MMFFLGLIIGFLVSFFCLKRSIQKNGAGQLKVCQSCPFFSIKQSSDVVEDKHE